RPAVFFRRVSTDSRPELNVLWRKCVDSWQRHIADEHVNADLHIHMVKNLLIVEDEKPAIDRLVGMLDDFHHEVPIAGIAMSVRQTVNWLGRNPMPDLILMDISLTDGSSFDIFDKTNITCPVIFITAYNEFWQEAFEHHGIDYLLKPLKKEK